MCASSATASAPCAIIQSTDDESGTISNYGCPYFPAGATCSQFTGVIQLLHDCNACINILECCMKPAYLPACLLCCASKAVQDQTCCTRPYDVWRHADNQPEILFQCNIVHLFITSSHHDSWLDHCWYAGECADSYECNARMTESEGALGISTTVGVCVTPIAAGSACTAGYGNTKLER